MSHNNVIFIYGPTAVGKTDFVYALAEHVPIAIINMDVGQFYTPLSIGTAKPDWRSSAIDHYLFDILDKPIDFTVAEYRSQVLALVDRIHKEQKIPVLVGGSGFYLKSLLFPPQTPTVSVKTSESREYSWELLNVIDPERAEAINPHDTYRIIRALDIWYATGTQPSQYKPLYRPLFPYTLVSLQRDRNDLYDHIDRRVVAMFKQGWVNEVMALKGTDWDMFLQEKGLIGYREILKMLDYPYDQQILKQVINRIQQLTRHYAKRQMTFWRMLEKECSSVISSHSESNTIVSFNLTSGPVNLYINRLAQCLVSN